MVAAPKPEQRSAEKAETSEAPQHKQSRPAAICRRWGKILGTSAGIAALYLGYNRLESAHFSRSNHRLLEAEHGAVKVDALTLGRWSDDAMFHFPNAVQAALARVCAVDRGLSQLQQTGLHIKVISAEHWHYPPALKCVRAADGTFNINGDFVYRLLDTSELATLQVSPSVRAELAAYHVLPSIASTWHQHDLATRMKRRGISAGVLASDLCATALVRENAASTLLAKTMSSEAKEALERSARWQSDLLMGWKVTREAVLPPSVVASNLRSDWQVESAGELAERNGTARTSISQLLQQTISARIGIDLSQASGRTFPAQELREFVQTEMHAAHEIVRCTQLHLLGNQIDFLQQYMEGTLPGLTQMQFEGGARPFVDVHKNILALRELYCSTSALDIDDVIALPAARKCIVDGIAVLETHAQRLVVEENGKLSISTRSAFNVDETLQLALYLDKLLRPSNDQALDLKDRVHAVIMRMGRAAGESFTIQNQSDSFYMNYVLRPVADELVRIISAESGANLADSELTLVLRLEALRDEDRRAQKDKNLSSTDGFEFLSGLTPREAEWIKFICSYYVAYPVLTRHWDRFAGCSAEDVRYTFDTAWFRSLEPSTQRAVLKDIVSILPGAPTNTILFNSPTGLPRLPILYEMRSYFADLRHATEALPSIEASLLIEALCALPVPLRHSLVSAGGSDMSKIEREVACLASPTLGTEGPLLLAIQECAGANPKYANYATPAGARHLLTSAFPKVLWAPNVSVLTASAVHQLSWGLEYSSKIRAHIEVGTPILESHFRAANELVGFDVAISRPTAWISSAVRSLVDWRVDPGLKPGVYYQNPQESVGEIAPIDGPKAALIIHGPNRNSDFTMNFEADAKNWEIALAQGYGCESVRVSPGSAVEMREAIAQLRTLVPDSNTDIAIVIIAHGGASPLMINGTFSDPTTGAWHLGHSGMRSSFGLQETDLKALVNTELVPHVRTVTIIVDTCHAGALSD